MEDAAACRVRDQATQVPQVTGHALESQFPLGLALAGLALASGAKVPAFDAAGETAMEKPAETAIVTTIGHHRGEGVAILKAEK